MVHRYRKHANESSRPNGCSVTCLRAQQHQPIAGRPSIRALQIGCNAPMLATYDPTWSRSAITYLTQWIIVAASWHHERSHNREALSEMHPLWVYTASCEPCRL